MPKRKKATTVEAKASRENTSFGVLPNFEFMPTPANMAWVRNRKIVIPLILAIALLIILLPHLVVAWVDKKPITIFEYYKTLDQKYGKDIKEQLISEKLIENEAQSRKVTLNNNEVSDQVKQTEDQASGSANLEMALEQQGMTRADFEKQVKLQILIKKMFEPEATVSTQEVEQYITQNAEQLGEVTDQLRTSILDQLKQQKLIEVFRAWLEQAQQSNRVTRI
jgi:foldase protein PrsA